MREAEKRWWLHGKQPAKEVHIKYSELDVKDADKGSTKLDCWSPGKEEVRGRSGIIDPCIEMAVCSYYRSFY